MLILTTANTRTAKKMAAAKAMPKFNEEDLFFLFFEKGFVLDIKNILVFF